MLTPSSSINGEIGGWAGSNTGLVNIISEERSRTYYNTLTCKCIRIGETGVGKSWASSGACIRYVFTKERRWAIRHTCHVYSV